MIKGVVVRGSETPNVTWSSNVAGMVGLMVTAFAASNLECVRPGAVVRYRQSRQRVDSIVLRQMAELVAARSSVCAIATR
ncbi:hypothetical protein LQG66_10590 [Bradyrhizobium ontarionense]|uniref:Uncharacterized protein n=1 Tax=Bradyrhizobium ontarionense TaxID=2898149 RepID=A0ABY3RHA6_9BRAD|nr:hypothetical protein [Bradyrhizobium sp. A19]UFZ06711.1 hypothetical protein LQG66_10590 [Bradyrhizobium sp. A19]